MKFFSIILSLFLIQCVGKGGKKSGQSEPNSTGGGSSPGTGDPRTSGTNPESNTGDSDAEGHASRMDALKAQKWLAAGPGYKDYLEEVSKKGKLSGEERTFNLKDLLLSLYEDGYTLKNKANAIEDKGTKGFKALFERFKWEKSGFPVSVKNLDAAIGDSSFSGDYQFVFAEITDLKAWDNLLAFGELLFQSHELRQKQERLDFDRFVVAELAKVGSNEALKQYWGNMKEINLLSPTYGVIIGTHKIGSVNSVFNALETMKNKRLEMLGNVAIAHGNLELTWGKSLRRLVTLQGELKKGALKVAKIIENPTNSP